MLMPIVALLIIFQVYWNRSVRLLAYKLYSNIIFVTIYYFNNYIQDPNIDTMNFFDADGYYNEYTVKKQKQTRYFEYLDAVLCFF